MVINYPASCCQLPIALVASVLLLLSSLSIWRTNEKKKRFFPTSLTQTNPIIHYFIIMSFWSLHTFLTERKKDTQNYILYRHTQWEAQKIPFKIYDAFNLLSKWIKKSPFFCSFIFSLLLLSYCFCWLLFLLPYFFLLHPF